MCFDENNINYDDIIKKESSEISSAPLYGFDANSMTLYLKAIPCEISRWDILSRIRDTEGFVSLSLSEPLKT